MPSVIQPAWGNLGIICVRGAAQTTDQVAQRARDQGFDAQPSCLHSDSEFECLSLHFESLQQIPAALRQDLDFIRTQVVHGILYRDATPLAKESNKAIEALGQRLSVFLGAAAALPGSSQAFVAISPELPDAPMRTRLPHQLMFFARVAQESDHSDKADAEHVAFAQTAERLAFAIQNIDWVSEGAIPGYKLDVGPFDGSLSSLQRQARSMLEAVKKAKLSKGGRPRLPPEFVQATFWLRDLYISAGGKFTHTPREKTEYKGVPRSPAGRFVLEFFGLIDKNITAVQVSTLLSETIAYHSR